MEIALIADDTKKELMTQFCIAYCGILSKHKLCATGTTGKYIEEATGLHVEKLLSGEHGGEQQITSRVAYNEIDVLLFFRSTQPDLGYKEEEATLLRMCDIHNVPVYSEKHWELIDKYMSLAHDVGINLILTPVITPPLDTAKGTKRTCTQLASVLFI